MGRRTSKLKQKKLYEPDTALSTLSAPHILIICHATINMVYKKGVFDISIFLKHWDIWTLCFPTFHWCTNQMDNLSTEKRSKVMRSIKSQNTRPEIKVRKALRNLGIGYRLKKRVFSSTPDILMKGRKTAIFVNGCFWHRHDCWIYRPPRSRVEYWNTKLENNVQRDKRNWQEFLDAGWKVIVVWECALQGRERIPEKLLSQKLRELISCNPGFYEVRGEAIA